MGTGVAAGVASPADAAPSDGQICEGLDSGKIDTTGDPQTVTVTAPDGFLIDGYCVKAGSAEQGDGAVYVTVDPPISSITFGYPGGKAVSHYSTSYAPIEEPTPTPTETVTSTPTLTVSPSEISDPSETPTPAQIVTVKGTETSRPSTGTSTGTSTSTSDALPTLVNAGQAGSSSGDGGLKYPVVLLGLLLLVAGALVGFGGRSRGAHQV